MLEQQFATTLSCLSRGSLDDKMRWIFSLYDVNNCGYITQQELTSVVASIYALLGHSTQASAANADTESRVAQIFRSMDANGDGVVSVDEFCHWCAQVGSLA